MRRITAIISALFLITVLPAGCPMDGPDGGKPPDTLTLRTTAPLEALKGDTVTLKVSWPDDVDPANVIIHWFQTFGRKVSILNADTAEASFTAPSLDKDQMLTFRVDVETAGGQVFSQTASVKIKADPNYVSPGSGGSDTEKDPYPVVKISTTKGSITIKLNRVKAPLTVNNFLRYVDDGFYDGTLFHRVIADFVIQGGGYDEDLQLKATRPPILNESDNGLSNVRGTISMAHAASPDSGTSQFFINVVDNLNLNYDNPNTPALADGNKHAVFGEVTEGMAVVDAIAAVETESRDGMSNVPKENVVIRSIRRVSSSGGSTDGRDNSISPTTSTDR